MLRTLAVTSGLASVVTAVAVGGGLMSAGTPVLDAAGDLAAAATGPSATPSVAPLVALSVAPLGRKELAERARQTVGDDAVATWAGLRLVEISAAGVTKAYALERLWRDCPLVELPESVTASPGPQD